MKKLSTLLFTLLSLYVNAQFASNSFSAKTDFATPISPGNPQGCYAEDLNGDGYKEMIVANLSAQTISIYLNAGIAGSISSLTYPSSFTLTCYSSASPSTVNAADIDGDGKNEILVGYGAASNNRISIFKNLYNGVTFGSSSFSRSDFVSGTVSTTAPNSIYTDDLNNDGKKDLVVTNYGDATFSVFTNASSPGTIAFSNMSTYPAGINAAYTAIADFNNDGKKDIAVSNWGNSNISLYRNTSVTSASISLVSAGTLSTGNSPHYIKSADFDADGKMDLAVANYYSQTVSIYRNTDSVGLITFAPKFDLFLATGAYPQGLILTDLDYNGRPDIAVNMAGLSGFMAFKNNHSSGIISASDFSSSTTFVSGTTPVPLNAHDLDGDLRPEVYLSNYSSNTFSVYKNRNLSPEPTLITQSVATSVGTNSATITLMKGNGTKRLVTMRVNGQSSVNPADTSWYSASAVFGNGSNLGSSNYVVYADTGSVITVTGLSQGVSYQINVYEYNGIGGFCNYLTSSYASASLVLGDVFYSKSSGALNLLASWGSNPDGSGTAPLSFGNVNTTFIVVNNPAPTLTANWIVSGTGSFVTIGDGSNALNVTIPSGSSIFTDSLSVRSYATLTFSGGLVCNKVYFDSLSTAQFTNSTVQSIPGFTYYNLVAASGVKNLGNNCTVRGSLNLLTSINTGAYLLTLGTSATQPGVLNRNASGAIVGRFKRWFAASVNSGNTGLFPMATSTLYYRPAQIDFTSAPSTGGTLTAEFIGTPPGNSGLPLYDFSNGFVEINKASVNGYWKMDASGFTGGTYTVTLTGTGFYGVNVVADLRILKRNTSGAWFLQGTAITGTGTTSIPVVGRSGMSGFGEFTLSGDSTVNPLPVTWLDVKAEYLEEQALISWSTAREINNDRFEIEKAVGSNPDFAVIGKVLPAGGSGVQQYKFEDKDVNKHFTNAYRIKQVDKDGKYTYSKTVTLESLLSSEPLVYPNPGTGQIQVSGVIKPAGVRVISVQGSMVMEATLNGPAVDLSLLKPGVYMLEFYYADGSVLYTRYLRE